MTVNNQTYAFILLNPRLSIIGCSLYTVVLKKICGIDYLQLMMSKIFSHDKI